MLQIKRTIAALETTREGIESCAPDLLAEIRESQLDITLPVLRWSQVGRVKLLFVGLLILTECEFGITSSPLSEAAHQAINSMLAQASRHGSAGTQRGDDQAEVVVAEPYSVFAHGPMVP
jgi:hypothetical protein